MSLETQFTLKSNEQYISYLRSHSYWYKELNRHPSIFPTFEEEVKTTYKLRMSDRLEKIMNTMDMITSIVSSLK